MALSPPLHPTRTGAPPRRTWSWPTRSVCAKPMRRALCAALQSLMQLPEMLQERVILASQRRGRQERWKRQPSPSRL